MAKNIGLLMVEEGLLSSDALDRAVRRKHSQGGSLALNLVLEGAVDEHRLLEFYRKSYDLPVASEEAVASVDDSTFSLIPLEIIYDSGIIPLFIQDEQHLAVGLVDPTDAGLIAEATFFSGYGLVQHLITVGQMARHFTRLARQPWKVSVQEAEMLTRDPQLTLDQASQQLLEQTAALEHRLEAVLEASLDEVYHADPLPDEGGSIFMADWGDAGVSSIRIQAPSSESRAVVVDADDFRPPTPSGEHVRVPTASGIFREASLSKDKVDDIAMQPDWKGPGILEGEAVTDRGTVKMLGFPVEQTARPTTAKKLVPVIAERASGFGTRPKTKVPSVPAAKPAERDVQQNFYLLTRLGDMLGEPDPRVGLAMAAISRKIAEANERDELGTAVVAGLADLYELCVVTTLSGPRAVIWRSYRKGRPARELVGRKVEIQDGSVLHRIAQERVFYWGPLPLESNLRSALDVAHTNNVLVAPVELRSKTILILYLDSGTSRFPVPGRPIERLLVDVSHGLERVILMRRRGRRK